MLSTCFKPIYVVATGCWWWWWWWWRRRRRRKTASVFRPSPLGSSPLFLPSSPLSIYLALLLRYWSRSRHPWNCTIFLFIQIRHSVLVCWHFCNFHRNNYYSHGNLIKASIHQSKQLNICGHHKISIMPLKYAFQGQRKGWGYGAKTPPKLN